MEEIKTAKDNQNYEQEINEINLRLKRTIILIMTYIEKIEGILKNGAKKQEKKKGFEFKVKVNTMFGSK